MIRPVSRSRSLAPLNDFQVLKGGSERSMQNFGAPVSATYEARLLIEDDRAKGQHGVGALYAIHQRSENRILKIVEGRRPLIAVKARQPRRPSCFPLASAA